MLGQASAERKLSFRERGRHAVGAQLKFVAVPDAEEPRTTVRVGGRTQSAHLIKSVAPTYPSAARDRGIHGSVRFDATIGVDGSIRCLNLVSGPLALYESARDAVRQWKYKPTILDHRAVQVQTVIDVDF